MCFSRHCRSNNPFNLIGMPRQWATFSMAIHQPDDMPYVVPPVPLLILPKYASVKTTVFQSLTYLLRFRNEIIDLISFSLLTAFFYSPRKITYCSFLEFGAKVYQFKSYVLSLSYTLFWSVAMFCIFPT